MHHRLTSENTKITIGYARLSVDLGQIGLEAQEAEIKALAKGRGWEVQEVVKETLPAYRRGEATPRPLFEALVKKCQQDPKSYRVIVYNLDRLTRSLKDFVTLRELAENGCEILACSGDLDLTSSTGQMTAAIVTSLKEMEIRELSRRIKANKEERKRRGEFIGGGQRSFGYDSGGKIRNEVPEEAEFLRQCMKKLKEGVSWQKLTDEANNLGITTPSGKVWTRNNFSKTFSSVGLYGLIVYHNEDGTKTLNPAPWKGIFPSEDYDFICSLKAEKEFYKGERTLSTPLSGAMSCTCGTPRPLASAGQRKYRCVKCNRSINKPKTERMILDIGLRLAYWTAETENLESKIDISSTLKEIEEKKAEKISHYQNLHEQGLISAEMLKAGLREAESIAQKKKSQLLAEKKRADSEFASREHYLLAQGKLLAQDLLHEDPKISRDAIKFIFPKILITDFKREKGMQGNYQAERVILTLRNGQSYNAKELGELLLSVPE